MTVSRSSFDICSNEPNWRYIDKVGSWLDEGKYGFVAFLDRYGYKAADNRDCNLDYDFLEDWQNALSEGFLLQAWYSDTPMTEEQYEDLTDPDYGKDDIFCGPYFIDQQPMGYFKFHGPRGLLQGPECTWEFKPTGWTEEFYFDRSLSPSWIYP